MPRSHPTPLRLLALLLFSASCSSPPPAVADHRHRTTTTLTITAAAVLPMATVTIPAWSSVVWRNRGDQPLEVSIRAAACPACETVMGFAAAADGARSIAIAPGAVASICFHDVGTFPFVATLGGVTHRGEIRVAEAP